MSDTLPVLGSSSPTICAPKSEYQACPSRSTTTSCGSASLRGKSNSVMTTRVRGPFGRVARHASEYLLPLIRVVQRREHALQGVAGRAARKERLDAVIARDADQPFSIRRRGDAVARLGELDVGGRPRVRRDLDGFRAGQVVTRSPDGNRIMA